MSKRSSNKNDTKAGNGLTTKRKRSLKEDVEDEGSAKFTKDETLNLISIWRDCDIQSLFKTTTRHNLIWETIAEAHNESVYYRTWKQVKSKIATLKAIYVTKKPRSGGATPTWPYYAAMHQVLSTREFYNDHNLLDSLDLESEKESENEEDFEKDEDMLEKKAEETEAPKMKINKIARAPHRVSEEKKKETAFMQ